MVNAGGVINIGEEAAPGGYDHDRAWKAITRIEDTLTRIFGLADEQGITTAAAADRVAEDRLAAAQPS